MPSTRTWKPSVTFHWTSPTTRQFAGASRDPSWIDTRIGALLRTRDVAGAGSLLDQLAAMGYRHPDLVAIAATHGIAFEPDAEASRRIALAVATLAEARSADIGPDVK